MDSQLFDGSWGFILTHPPAKRRHARGDLERLLVNSSYFTNVNLSYFTKVNLSYFTKVNLSYFTKLITPRRSAATAEGILKGFWLERFSTDAFAISVRAVACCSLLCSP